MKLPIVDNGTLWSVSHRLQEFKDGREYQRVVNENPDLFRLLESVIEHNPYVDVRNVAIICGALVCLAIESQIEANQLNEMFA